MKDIVVETVSKPARRKRKTLLSISSLESPVVLNTVTDTNTHTHTHTHAHTYTDTQTDRQTHTHTHTHLNLYCFYDILSKQLYIFLASERRDCCHRLNLSLSLPTTDISVVRGSLHYS